ncbi:hypothetical protein [Streptomyces xantholiticus]|uniref:Uncharacterized protein n=1 Tax=Streptomyces xantholiticus TaxID=68285 RepID=A0ABV1US19_9ACTN
MYDPEDAGFESEPFDPDDVVWVRGVDYVAGWRDATDAGGQLAEALTNAGFDNREPGPLLIATRHLFWHASGTDAWASR